MEKVSYENKVIDLINEGTSVHIATMAKQNEKQAFSLFKKIPSEYVKGVTRMECSIDYPLKEQIDFEFEIDEAFDYGDGTSSINVSKIIYEISKKYWELWKSHRNWFEGHSIYDLWIESVFIYKNKIGVVVGS